MKILFDFAGVVYSLAFQASAVMRSLANTTGGKKSLAALCFLSCGFQAFGQSQNFRIVIHNTGSASFASGGPHALAIYRRIQAGSWVLDHSPSRTVEPGGDYEYTSGPWSFHAAGFNDMSFRVDWGETGGQPLRQQQSRQYVGSTWVTDTIPLPPCGYRMTARNDFTGNPGSACWTSPGSPIVVHFYVYPGRTNALPVSLDTELADKRFQQCYTNSTATTQYWVQTICGNAVNLVMPPGAVHCLDITIPEACEITLCQMVPEVSADGTWSATMDCFETVAADDPRWTSGDPGAPKELEKDSTSKDDLGGIEYGSGTTNLALDATLKTGVGALKKAIEEGFNKTVEKLKGLTNNAQLSYLTNLSRLLSTNYSGTVHSSNNIYGEMPLSGLGGTHSNLLSGFGSGAGLPSSVAPSGRWTVMLAGVGVNMWPLANAKLVSASGIINGWILWCARLMFTLAVLWRVDVCIKDAMATQRIQSRDSTPVVKYFVSLGLSFGIVGVSAIGLWKLVTGPVGAATVAAALNSLTGVMGGVDAQEAWTLFVAFVPMADILSLLALYAGWYVASRWVVVGVWTAIQAIPL